MSGASRISIIPMGRPNRPGRKLVGGKPTWITCHETGNQAPGANSEMHRRFVHAGGGPAVVSFHYVVDDHESIQLLPDDEVAWHAGDGGGGTGNNRSVAIETCVNRGANWEQTIANLVKLVKHLMAEFNIPIERVVQHNHWSGKNCPTRLRSNNGAGWKAFIAQLQAPQVEPSPEKKIEAHWEANGGVTRYGIPLTPVRQELLEDGQMWSVRYYERAMLHTNPGRPVFEGLIGARYLRAIGEL